ncbi:HEAT repeat domain-containing protein [Elizabethkingia ursingii]|uniref:HEAT repeat domain-containing protein n=1 Tax=Elizabethkingia ursingii TaxID=1756150 RepID=UPI002012DAB2|nr:HEAT repeat domain-containing protein [Elizabethkingia ursingii]MCL1663304.1 HEAT repeat domain-containing protein [Elizabethkingia ursingii]MCL1670756.1 HEAT repeat domain-containing protein [Elizabethkingia ursingii]
MSLEEIFQDKSIKAKVKVSQIGEWLISQELPVDELLAFTDLQSGTNKATCIEAIEYATKKSVLMTDDALLSYVTKALGEEEARIKWESAKVIGNISKQHADKLAPAIAGLLKNAEDKGTVVRWATAYALAEILKLKMDYNKTLLPKIEILCEKEEDNGVKKKYIDAIKKVKKN